MKRECTILAVTSGKGGVGKSVVAVNLAETLVQAGRRVALIDADFGQGACPLLLNETPETTLADVIRKSASLADVPHRTTSGLTLVHSVAEPGEAGGRERMVYEQLDTLLATLRADHEFIVVDTPAGAEGPVRWALDRADLGILVIAGEPTSIADAYRLAKLVWQSDPAYPLSTIVNFADSEEDARSIAERFGHVTEHFTGHVPNFLGWVPFSAQIRYSVQEQVPAVRIPGRVQDAFEHIAQTLTKGRNVAFEPLSHVE